MSNPPSQPLVKICGLTNVNEALHCAKLGADWIGLNFHPVSPRYVDAKNAAAIVDALPSTCEAVGLFVDRPTEEITRLASEVVFRIVQLHGKETPESYLAFHDFMLIRAYRIGSPEAIDAMLADLERAERLGRAPDAVLVDAYVAGQQGGTGHAITDTLLDLLPPLPRLILAGGLTPENVAERVAKVHPWMVDVASGVESSPGRKDPDKVARFIENARPPKIGG